MFEISKMNLNPVFLRKHHLKVMQEKLVKHLRRNDSKLQENFGKKAFKKFGVLYTLFPNSPLGEISLYPLTQVNLYFFAYFFTSLHFHHTLQ